MISRGRKRERGRKSGAQSVGACNLSESTPMASWNQRWPGYGASRCLSEFHGTSITSARGLRDSSEPSDKSYTKCGWGWEDRPNHRNRKEKTLCNLAHRQPPCSIGAGQAPNPRHIVSRVKYFYGDFSFAQENSTISAIWSETISSRTAKLFTFISGVAKIWSPQ